MQTFSKLPQSFLAVQSAPWCPGVNNSQKETSVSVDSRRGSALSFLPKKAVFMLGFSTKPGMFRPFDYFFPSFFFFFFFKHSPLLPLVALYFLMIFFFLLRKAISSPFPLPAPHKSHMPWQTFVLHTNAWCLSWPREDGLVLELLSRPGWKGVFVSTVMQDGSNATSVPNNNALSLWASVLSLALHCESCLQLLPPGSL